MSEGKDRDDIPEPDAPEDAAERARAESFARRIDAMLTGEAPPPLMASDERELLEVATMLRAGYAAVSLDEGRRDALIDGALSKASGRAKPAAPDAARADDPAPLRHRSRRNRRRVMARALPWSAAVVAAAAAVMLFVTRPQTVTTATVETVSVPEVQRSRSAEPLIGRIDRAAAGEARSRIDVIYADRLGGYRSAYLDRRGPGGQP